MSTFPFQTHGMHGTKTYQAWRSMLNRCFNPNTESYYRYGARGITVCARWRHSFQNFLDDLGIAPPGLSLNRIDNDGDYSPDNCCWSTPEEQARNRSKRRPLLSNDPTRCISLTRAGTFKVRIRLTPSRRIQNTFGSLDEAEEFRSEVEYEREFQRALGLF